MEAEALQLPPPPPPTTTDGATAWTDPRLARRCPPLGSECTSSAGPSRGMMCRLDGQSLNPSPEPKKNFLLAGHLRRPNGDPANI